VSQPSRYCPFLNRDDDRCAEHFQVGSLNSTFAHCFGEYGQCAVYKEMLLERTVRRAEAKVVMLSVRGREIESIPAAA
jgi:hypothetical protein